VLAEHDDADLRARVPQGRGEPDALVGPVGRHADVGHDHVGLFGRDDSLERGKIANGRHDLHVGVMPQQLAEALADEKVVLRQRHADRHGTIVPAGSVRAPAMGRA
jgi:hypothetical protein